MGVNNSLLKSIQTIVDKEVESASFDKTRQAQVITNNNDGTYTIRLDGVLYNNVMTYPYTDVLNVGDVVKVCIPSNQTNHMYIKSSQGDKAYVKKSGDTMTGTLTLPKLDIIGANNRVFSFKKTIDDTNLDIGWDYSNGDGSGVALRSTDAGGGFVLYARNNTTAEYSLAGKTDGTLIWGRIGFSSVTSENVGSVIYKGTATSYNPIQFDDVNDTWGLGVTIGAGGRTIIGAGESASSLKSRSGYGANAEVMLIGSDGNVEIWTNCNDETLASAKKIKFGSNGNIAIPLESSIILSDGSDRTALSYVRVGRWGGTDNLYLQSDGYNAIYVGDTSHTTTGRVYLQYARNDFYAPLYAPAYNNSSDRRLKKNISDIDDSKDFLLALKPKFYKWEYEYNEDNKQHTGFIAQDVIELMELFGIDWKDSGIVGESKDGYYTLNYIEFIPMLVYLCQSQQKEIDELKEKIGELL